MNDPDTTSSLEDIAIVGMVGRFPGARDVGEFWQNLCERRDSISSFSDEELEGEGVERALLSSPNYVKAGGVIEGVKMFDAPFFSLTPREAEVMDPQQRVFLECAWSALEDAGYDPETYRGRIGVYAGAGINGYLLNIYSNPHLLETVSAFQAVIGNEKDHLTTLVSYKLNLKGPSVTVQTTCSTSLVAVGLACQSLLCYQSDMALAGGVSINVPQKSGYLYEEGGISSPDGRCRAFDAKARGIVSGDGVGIVVLKRLADALTDGDRIHAVIKGSAINNDGSGKVGYAAPSVGGQAEVIAEALAMARVNPETVTYLEAHGTGTTLGDPVEVAALTQAFRAATNKKSFCALGSVKTNIGHLNTAAGVAGLIKTALALEHRFLPPTLHYERPNPKIDFPSSPFFVNTELTEWATPHGVPRRAGVSSFGIGGTNAHVILEEAPAQEASGKCRPGQLLVLSAKTDSALEVMTANLAKYLRGHTDVNLADVAYTLQVGRRRFEHRRTAVCAGVRDAVEALEALDSPRARARRADSREQPVVMMFSGQGAQYANMGRDLYRHENAFREQIDLCSEMLLPHLGLDLRDVLYPKNGHVEEGSPRLDSTRFAQPALFVTEYALVQLWMRWGVRPAAMIGHSVGEYVAACVAGVMSLKDALALVAARGRLMQQMPRGAMLAVPLPEEDVRSALAGDGRVSLAAINAPSLCVVSGTAEAVDQLAERYAGEGIATHLLHTSHAFHSEMMEPVLDEFLQQVRGVTLAPPRTPYMSNVSGTWITDAEVTTPAYWTRHLRQTVRFSEGVAGLLKSPGHIFLEVGPGHSLGASVRQAQGFPADAVTLSTLPAARGKESGMAFLLAALGELWAAGAKVDWHGFNDEERRRIPLPTYPFERQPYWIAGAKSASTQGGPSSGTRPGPADRFHVPVWTQSPEKSLQPYNASGEKSSTLILTDDCGLGAELAKHLEELNHAVVTAAAGDGFARLGEGAYTVNPEMREDYELLFAALDAGNKLPQKIVHLWSLTPDVESARAATEFSGEYQARGFYSLVLLAQVLAGRDDARHFDIEVVTNNLHDVTGEEKLCPQKATILGACKVIPQEIPNVHCRSIDVVLHGAGGGAARQLVEQLSEEFALKQAEPLVAYRGSRRWVRRFERVRLDDRVRPGTPLREGGVYLITGGLRGVGFALARHLARTARAKLILTEQSNFPRRAEWDAWLSAHGDQHEASRNIQKVRALEGLGGEVSVIGVEMFNPEGMRAAIVEARERFGEINGVLHAEFSPGQTFVGSKGAEPAADALTVNVRGMLLLESLLQDAELDFLVLLSSANSITGAPGQVDDCAASAFLDAFAHYRSAVHGRPTLAIDWDAPQWEAWPAHLAALDPELEMQTRRSDERDGLSLEDGVAAFERVLPFPLTQVVVSMRNFAPVPAPRVALSAAQLAEKLSAASASKLGASRVKPKSAYVAPSNQVERTIADAWQAVLGVKRVGLNDNFFDLGGNSLLGIQLMSMLRRAFLLELPMSILFESSTVAEQAAVVSETRRKENELEELERMLNEIEGLSSEDLEARLALIAQQGGAEAT